MPLHTSNIIMQKTDTAPSGTAQTEGSLYYDDSEARLKAYDGTAWGEPSRGPNYDRPGDGPYAVDSYTKVLIHSDGPNNGTAFVNSGLTNPGTVTRNADVIHDAAHNIASIGSTALYFDGSIDCYLQIADHADFDAGANPYTIDCWFKNLSNASNWKVLIDNRDSSNSHNGLGQFGAAPSGNFRVHNIHGTIGDNSDLNCFDGQWHHVAFQRVGDQTSIHIDGVFMISGTNNNASHQSTCPVRLGNSDHGLETGTHEPFHGYIVEPRISVGIARWWRTNFQLWGSAGKWGKTF